MFLERIQEITCACQYLNANEITSFSIEVKIDVQYRRLKSNGKIVVHVIQIALFLKYRSTCLSMVSDTVKWSRIDSIRLSLIRWSNGVLLL